MMQAAELFEVFLFLAVIAYVPSASYKKCFNHEMCLRSTKCTAEESMETG